MQLVHYITLPIHIYDVTYAGEKIKKTPVILAHAQNFHMICNLSGYLY